MNDKSEMTLKVLSLKISPPMASEEGPRVICLTENFGSYYQETYHPYIIQIERIET